MKIISLPPIIEKDELRRTNPLSQKPHLSKQQMKTRKRELKKDELNNKSQPSPEPSQTTVTDFFTTQKPKLIVPSSILTAFPFDVSMTPLEEEKTVESLPPPKKLKKTPHSDPDLLPDSDTPMSSSAHQW